MACTSFNFDGSLHDILPVLWLGGTLYFHPLLQGKEKQWNSIKSCVTFFFTQPIKIPYFNPERFCSLRNLVVIDCGKLHFLSRIPKSQEVKLHGIRIELSGVKNVLNQIPGVTFTHVEVETVAQNKSKLVVYIATKSSAHVSTEVRRALKRELSSLNIPVFIIPIGESDIPSTPGGKLDLKKLTSTWSCSSPAKTEIEELVLQSYQKSLDLDDDTKMLFGMESDFFEYGGNSIAVVSLAEELSSLLNKSVSTNNILESQTPKQFLEGISQLPCPSSHLEISISSSSRKLSFFQEALISNNALQVGPTYNLPYVLCINGNINSLRLNVVLEIILSYLHSAYKQNGLHHSNQWSNAKGNIVRHVNYSSYGSNGKSKAMNDIQLDSVLPIIFKVCPFRCTVYSISINTVIVSIVLHHLVFDQQTLLNIDKALTELYQDPSANLQEIEPYSYFISYEEQRVKSSDSSSLTFWKDLLNLCTPFVDFPTTFAQKTNLKYHGNATKCTLSSETLSEVFRFCAQNKVSQPSLFLATYGLMIHRYSCPTQGFAIGCTMSLRSSLNNQRMHTKFQNMFGILINVLPCLFSQAQLEKSPKELVSDISRWFQNARNHSWYPFSELVKLWCGENDTPLRLPQFLFNFLSVNPDQTLEMGQDICVQRVDVHTYTAKAELLLDVTATKNGTFEVSLEYNTGLFSRHTATEILNEYCAILRDIIHSNVLPPIHHLSNVSQQTTSAHFHHSPLNDYQLTKYQRAIYQCKVPEDQHVLFHSCFSVCLNPDIDTHKIIQILGQFPQLALTVCKKGDEMSMTFRDGIKLQIQFEYASESKEATSIKHCFFSWPMDIHSVTEPLFRCVVIENLSTKQKEMFCVSHCMLLDEISLHSLVNQLLKQFQRLETPSIATPYLGLFKEAQHEGADSTHHPLSCDKTLLPLQIDSIHLPQVSIPTVVNLNFKFNLQIPPDDYVAFCCLLSSLLLSTLQQSSHAHFALQCPEMDTTLTSNEALLPICIDINTEDSIDDMVTTIKSKLRSIYAQVISEDFFYWDSPNNNVNPFTSPLHDMLVKILPSTVPSKHATISYPQRFPLCVTFYSDEILLMSLLGHEQTNQAQKTLKNLIQSLQPTSITRNTIISELKVEYTPSVLKVNPQCEGTDLSNKRYWEHSVNISISYCSVSQQVCWMM